MRTQSFLFPVLFFLTGCGLNQTSPNQMLRKFREDFAKETDSNNAKIVAWENVIDSLNKLADTNRTMALKAIDYLLSEKALLGKNQIFDLHFAKGDLYYLNRNFNESLGEFTKAAQVDNFWSPKVLAAEAGDYLKLRQNNRALEALARAAEINYDYLWNIGNYYEITSQKDSAVYFYEKLYQYDTYFYRYCKERIDVLENGKAMPFTELVYKDRERVVFMMKAVQ